MEPSGAFQLWHGESSSPPSANIANAGPKAALSFLQSQLQEMESHNEMMKGKERELVDFLRVYESLLILREKMANDLTILAKLFQLVGCGPVLDEQFLNNSTLIEQSDGEVDEDFDYFLDESILMSAGVKRDDDIRLFFQSLLDIGRHETRLEYQRIQVSQLEKQVGSLKNELLLWEVAYERKKNSHERKLGSMQKERSELLAKAARYLQRFRDDEIQLKDIPRKFEEDVVLDETVERYRKKAMTPEHVKDLEMFGRLSRRLEVYRKDENAARKTYKRQAELLHDEVRKITLKLLRSKDDLLDKDSDFIDFCAQLRTEMQTAQKEVQNEREKLLLKKQELSNLGNGD